MSFVALAVHVLLLMLVCWMGAETLASDDRLARQVFGKLSVLFGMYALMCLIIDGFLACKPGISMPGLHAFSYC
ncbi:hypothetical protein [Bifidobacterium breve]|uniref:hypothetical protein n=1 Tax=Bifidobacterium breve TaxID=1685 RepID=UPI003CFF63F0